METISDQIRKLASDGHSKSKIAAMLNIRYQHVQKVLVDAGLHIPKSRYMTSKIKRSKPALSETLLVNSGFSRVGEWRITGIELKLPEGIPTHQGVYAFALDGNVQYVGVAKIGLRKRLYFYAKPGSTQKTSRRLNNLMLSLLREGRSIMLLVATPADLNWNGLPVHGSAGLEIGLIKNFNLPWNMQGTK